MPASWSGARRACALVPLSLVLAAACGDGPTAEGALVARVAHLDVDGPASRTWDAGAVQGADVCARDANGQGVEGVPLRWAVQQDAGAPALPVLTQADSVTHSTGCAFVMYRFPATPGTWRVAAVLGTSATPTVPATGDGVRTRVITFTAVEPVAGSLDLAESAVWLQPGDLSALTLQVLSTRFVPGAPLPGPLAWTASTPGVAELADSVTVRGLAHGTTLLRATSGTLSDTVRAYVLAPFVASQVSVGLIACGIVDGRGAHCWPASAGSNFSRTPVPLAGGEALVSVAEGETHACGLEADGRALCWGSNVAGELGSPTTVTSDVPPTPVATALRFRQVRAASGAGTVVSRATCGLDLDGGVHCWGSNASGVFGAAEPASSTTPVRVPLAVPIVELAMSRSHACGRAADGSLFCWGRNDTGQLADADAANRLPRRVATTLRFTHVVVGEAFTCAIADDARAHCWGANGSGQLGIGSDDATRATPSPVAGGLSFASLSAGSATACGVTTAGAVHCWGHNRFSVLGAPLSVTQSRVPLAVATPGPVEAVSVGHDLFSSTFSVCARGVDGVVTCWGAETALANPNQTAQCTFDKGDPPRACRALPLPVLWLPDGRAVR